VRSDFGADKLDHLSNRDCVCLHLVSHKYQLLDLFLQRKNIFSLTEAEIGIMLSGYITPRTLGRDVTNETSTNKEALGQLFL